MSVIANVLVNLLASIRNAEILVLDPAGQTRSVVLSVILQCVFVLRIILVTPSRSVHQDHVRMKNSFPSIRMFKLVLLKYLSLYGYNTYYLSIVSNFLISQNRFSCSRQSLSVHSITMRFQCDMQRAKRCWILLLLV